MKQSVWVQSEWSGTFAGNKNKTAPMVSPLQSPNICNSWIYCYTQVTVIAPLWSKRNWSPWIPQTHWSARYIQLPVHILSAILTHSRATLIPHQEAPSARKQPLGHLLRSDSMVWSCTTINARATSKSIQTTRVTSLTICLSVLARNSRWSRRPVRISQRP